MKEATIRYLVAIPLPEPSRSQLARLKASLRPTGWRDTLDPHITLLAPDRPTLPPEGARNSFRNLVLDLPPFRVRAHRLHRFSRHHRHTIVLVPDDPTPLINLFNAVMAKCSWQETTASSRRTYQPHITITNQVPDGQQEHIESRLMDLEPTVGFECSELVLYAKRARWPAWQELERHFLSNPS